MLKWSDDQPSVAALQGRFAAAAPFPHIVLDDVIDGDPETVTGAFPDGDWPGWNRYKEMYQANKRQCGDAAIIPPVLKAMIAELSEPAFLRFLEDITGIERLIVDPYLDGGGLHSSGPGGILMPHTDFHYLANLHLYRRINVILYLNPDWDAAWGGSLGLYRKGNKIPDVRVVPQFGRMVIFRTDHKSVHGFADRIAEGHWRNSIALYYYTATEADTFSGDETTYWQDHGKIGLASRAQLGLHKALLGTSTLFAKLAHRANPHTGTLGIERVAAKLRSRAE